MIYLGFLVSLLAVGPAAAHGTLPGGGGFYAGAAHPLLALEHLLVLLAGGLVLGRDGGRWALFALGAGLAVGLWSGFEAPWVAAVLLTLVLGFGGLLALQIRLPGGICVALFWVMGAAVGAESEIPLVDAAAGVLGLIVAVFLIVLNAVALGSVLAGPRGMIVLRVAGAWMMAAALMVLALQVRGLA